jgi:hypothetical protein
MGMTRETGQRVGGLAGSPNTRDGAYQPLVRPAARVAAWMCGARR